MSGADQSAARIRATAKLLRQLLVNEAAYRQRWLDRTERAVDADEVSYAAVASLLADWGVREGELDYHADRRSVRDRVRCALRGTRCSPTTLRWFVGAFSMSQEHATMLARTFHGQPGEHIAQDWKSWPGLPTDPHLTRMLDESHFIGSNRLPRRHRTIQVIEATVDGYLSYPYRFDTPHAVVFVEEGGSPGPLHADSSGLCAVDIELVKPLQRGETTMVIYDTIFDYREPAPPTFRRATRSPIDTVNMKVKFDPAALPAEVRWQIWSSDDAEPTISEPVKLDADHAAHRCIAGLVRGIVGFTWKW